MRPEEYEELLALRTRITVALLAVSQLQRKHADPAQAARLSRYALEALLAARADLNRIDDLIARLERGQRMDHDSFLSSYPPLPEESREE